MGASFASLDARHAPAFMSDIVVVFRSAKRRPQRAWVVVCCATPRLSFRVDATPGVKAVVRRLVPSPTGVPIPQGKTMVAVAARSAVLALGLAALVGPVLSAVPAIASAEEVLAQSLVGEWNGEWIFAAGKSTRGRASMTILNVEGAKVRGRMQVDTTGTRSRFPSSDFNFSGQLSGDRLTFQTQKSYFDFTIVDATHMTGTSLGLSRTEYSLTKQK